MSFTLISCFAFLWSNTTLDAVGDDLTPTELEIEAVQVEYVE